MHNAPIAVDDENHLATSTASARTSRSSARAQSVDREVGLRIRERRTMMGMSQHQLAKAIGVTYQQAHKYETGMNRISAGRLFETATVLNVPVSFFFDGISPGSAERLPSPRQRLGLELARSFAMIDNEKHQEALSQMARVLAGRGTDPDGGAGGD